MKIEIWSDIMCPFCYIGKRKFESALEQFPHKDQIEVEWRSYQLDPDVLPQAGKDIYTYLAERKGFSRQDSISSHEYVTQMAAKVGLEYNFDKVVVANSFDAHRLIQMAKQHELGDEAEERLFKAYFTEGKDVGDKKVLASLGTEIGLDEKEVEEMLKSDKYSDEVQADILEGHRLGLRGVPFFVIERKYGIAGAQDSAVFLQAIAQSFEEWEQQQALSN